MAKVSGREETGLSAGPNGRIDYDEVLKHVGQMGKFQTRVFLLLCLVSALSGLAVFAFGFTGYVPQYRCKVPFCEDAAGAKFYTNASAANLKERYPDYVVAAIPEASLKTKSECNIKTPKTEVSSCDEYMRALKDGSYEITTCSGDDVFYDPLVRSDSVVTQYHFSCQNYYLRDIFNALYMVGLLVGSMTFGLVSDKYGRMIALMASVLCVCLSSLVGAFMPEAGGYGLFRFITGMGGMGCFMVTFVICVEYVGLKYTMLLGILIEIPFAIGGLIVTVDAYLIRDWQTLQLVSHVPWLALLVLWFLIPESPRWLIATGRHEKAVKVIQKIAEANGKSVPEEVLNPNTLGTINENQKRTFEPAQPASQKENPTILDLFKKRSMALRTINMCFQWFAVTMCYYGLTFASADLAGDFYTNYALVILVEIPGYLFCVFTMDCWGRRPILSFCQLVSGVASILAGVMFIFESTEAKGLQLFFSLFGKLLASASFAIVYVYTAELYPTTIRNTAVGLCSFVARIGGILALLSNLLSVYWKGAPAVLLGVVALAAGVLAIFFPETVGMNLPETMEEAENIGERNKGRGLCTCVCPTYSDMRAKIKGKNTREN